MRANNTRTSEIDAKYFSLIGMSVCAAMRLGIWLFFGPRPVRGVSVHEFVVLSNSRLYEDIHILYFQVIS